MGWALQDSIVDSIFLTLLMYVCILSFIHSSIDHQGRVHNPTGEGVRAVSSEVKKKTSKFNNHTHAVEEHDTKIKEDGSARRNITRKNGGNDSLFDSKKKKQGGAG